MNTHTCRARSFLTMAVIMSGAAAHAQPTVTVTTDNTEIDTSCTIRIPEGTVIPDDDGNGVIHITADGVTVAFEEGSHLWGAAPDTPGDELAGIGVRLDGHTKVTLKGFAVHGFRAGMYLSNADGLTIDGADVSGNWRKHLLSTPQAEDGSDWLFPHNNDDNEWMRNYGAGIYVEKTGGATIRNVLCRNGQNGIIIDEVNDSKIYDNDCSFISGWGLAMWRSNRNVVTRNAFDFCVRGHSEGVYNRGQDSAGILMFEQNNENIIAENSATHGGDCFFGFGGREALGEDVPQGAAARPEQWYKRRGNNDNLLINNDLSYAPAHGIEMTFSFGNKFIGNRMVENAICGVWGGYSQDTFIAGNYFEGNGQLGYGLERGGVNIEHGRGNRIRNNVFKANRCGVHLWWDPDDNFRRMPWGKANHQGPDEHFLPSTDNYIIENAFEGDELVLHLRDADATYYSGNRLDGVGRELDVSENSVLITDPPPPSSWAVPDYPVYGESRPVGARDQLRGRGNIIMLPWGPWDHETPAIREGGQARGGVFYEVFGTEGAAKVERLDGDIEMNIEPGSRTDTSVPAKVYITGKSSGVVPYKVRIHADGLDEVVSGTFVSTTWSAIFFKWEGTPDEPPADLREWRSLSRSRDAVKTELSEIDFAYGWGGPKDLGLSNELSASDIGGDFFGMTARTRLPLPAGTWKFKTLSDDGVRLIADGQTIIENWTHHGPTPNEGTITLDNDKTVNLVLEHFEIRGYSVLKLELEKVD